MKKHDLGIYHERRLIPEASLYDAEEWADRFIWRRSRYVDQWEIKKHEDDRRYWLYIRFLPNPFAL